MIVYKLKRLHENKQRLNEAKVKDFHKGDEVKFTDTYVRTNIKEEDRDTVREQKLVVTEIDEDNNMFINFEGENKLLIDLNVGPMDIVKVSKSNTKEETDDDEQTNITKNESLKEDIQSIPPAPEGDDVGIAQIISDLIKDEYEAIDNYNSAIATATAYNMEDIAEVLTEIANDENTHVGSLQKVMGIVNKQTQSTEEGKEEATEIIEK